MACLKNPADDEGFTQETRHAWPAHCVTRIKSFSLLSKHGVSKIEPKGFDAGEYHWKLIIYPDGDDRVKKGDYISMCISMVGTASLPAGWEVNAMVSFFIYNYNLDKYLCLRGKVRRFHDINSKWGISKLMTKACFTEPSNGYLSKDNYCIFGAEVFVIKKPPVMEDVSFLTLADPYKREWKISDFSNRQNVWNSKEFNVGGFKWKVKLYPKGREEEGPHISIFLECIDSMSFSVHNKVKATCIFIARNTLGVKNYSKKVTKWFTSHESEGGFRKFMAIGDVGEPSNGFLDKDCFIVEIHLYVEAIHEPQKLE